MTNTAAGRMRLGEILEDAGLVEPNQLRRALEYGSFKLLPVGKALVALKFIDDWQLNNALKVQSLLRSSTVTREDAIEALRIGCSQRNASAATDSYTATQSKPPAIVEAAALPSAGEDLEVSRLLKRLEEVSKQPVINAESGTLLIQLADVYFAQNNCERAQDYYTRAIDKLGKTLGAGDGQLAIAYRKLANLHFVEGDLFEAQRLYEKCLAVKLKTLSDKHLDVAVCYEDLGEVMDAQGKYQEAEKHYQEALKIKEASFANGSIELKPLFNKIFHLYRLMEAKPQRKRVGDLAAECGLVESSKIPELVRESKTSNSPIGMLLVERGLLTQEMLQTLLRAQMFTSQGVIPEYVAVRAVKLAVQQSLSFDEALSALGWQEESTNSNSPEDMQELLSTMEDIMLLERQPNVPKYELAGLCTRLADLYYYRDSFPEAEIYYKRAESLLTHGESLSAVVLLILNKLVALQIAQKRYSEAEVLSWKILELTDKILGQGHFDGGVVLQNISGLKELQKSEAESAQLKQWSQHVFTSKVGADHPSLTSADAPAHGVAVYYMQHGELEKALTQFEIAFRLQTALNGDDSEDVIAIIKDYVPALKNAHRNDRAEKLSQRLGLQTAS